MMPWYEVYCPCGHVSRQYREPKKKPPQYCDEECRNLYHCGNGKKLKYVFTEEMDGRIREVYAKAVYMPAYHKTAPVKKLAKEMRVPRWRISKRAATLGCAMITKKEANWTEQELKILRRQAHKHPETIKRHLRKAGYHRSEQGIVLKRKRMRFLQNIEAETSRSLASCLGVDDHAVTRFIKKGWLKAKHRGTKRTEIQGGDQWFIKPKDIRDFIIENVSIIDFRKVDKFWLVELLIGRGYNIKV